LNRPTFDLDGKRNGRRREKGGVKRKEKAGETKMAKVYKKGIWGEVGKEEA